MKNVYILYHTILTLLLFSERGNRTKQNWRDIYEINVVSLNRNNKEAVVTINDETKTVKFLVVEEEFDYHDYSATYVTTFQKDIVVNDGICEEYEDVKYITTIGHEEALYSSQSNVSNVVKIVAQYEAAYDTCHSPMEYQTIEYK